MSPITASTREEAAFSDRVHKKKSHRKGESQDDGKRGRRRSIAA